MKQKEINKVLDAFLNKEITMKEAEMDLEFDCFCKMT